MDEVVTVGTSLTERPVTTGQVLNDNGYVVLKVPACDGSGYKRIRVPVHENPAIFYNIHSYFDEAEDEPKLPPNTGPQHRRGKGKNKQSWSR